MTNALVGRGATVNTGSPDRRHRSPGRPGSSVRRLFPDPDPAPLDDAGLTALYEPDRSRPALRVNFVSSLDGAITLEGYSEGLSGPADKRVFGLLRMVCDALVVAA